MKELIKTAPSVDQAIDLALAELALTREQVTVEILDYPEKRLFFKKPAKVKVSQIEDEFDIKDIFSEKPQQPKQEKPTVQEKPQQPKPTAGVKKEAQPKPAAPVSQSKPADFQAIPEEELSEKVKYAVEFLHSIIGQFHKGEYTLVPVKTQAGYVIKISGEDAGSLIGRKGETMEALSYLTSLAANRSDESFEKISVDVADYRQKKEKDLQANAKKIAIRVAKTGRAYTFEPMNPYDRRIIHATVGEVEGVKSESKGEGSQRRVMIISTAARKPRQNIDKPYSKGSNRNGGTRPYSRDQRDKAPAPAQKTREEKLVDNAGSALYSKIEL